MSNLSSPRYTSNMYQQQTRHQRSRPDISDVDIDLRNEYEKALDYIETLKHEQNSLKNSLRVALCNPNVNYEDVSSHRQSYHSNEFMSPRTMEKRMAELDQENQELKGLLETNATRINKMQRDQHEYLEKVKENEKLQFEIKELKAELNCLNKEFCTVTNKLLEVEVKNADLLSQSLKQNQELEGSDKAGILKYANYIFQLISSVGKNHFSYCCFEERFSKGSDFFNMIKSIDQSSLLLKSFKYITDLLININSQFYTSLPSFSQTPPERASKYDSYLQSNDISSMTEEGSERNYIKKAETPRNYDISELDVSPVTDIVGRMLERKSQRGRDRENLSKTEEIRSPLKNVALKGLPAESKDSSQFIKSSANAFSSTKYSQDVGDFSSSLRKMEDKSLRSIESSPKRVQFKIDNDRFADEEEDHISEYTGIEDPEQRINEGSQSDDVDSETSDNRDLVARYKRELRERTKGIEKSENKSKSQRMPIEEIKEASYEQPEDSSVSYSERSKLQKDRGYDNVSASRLKNFLKGDSERELELNEQSPSVSMRNKDRSSRHSEVSSVKTGDMSESWQINPKLRDYQINLEVVKKPSLKLRDKTSSLTRESSSNKFTPVVSPRVKSPKSSLTYQQLAIRKSRASIEELASKIVNRTGKHNTSTSVDRNKGTDFASASSSFLKTTPRNKCSPSPSSRIASIKDVKKKKKVDSYPKQTYDVIKGQELNKKKH